MREENSHNLNARMGTKGKGKKRCLGVHPHHGMVRGERRCSLAAGLLLVLCHELLDDLIPHVLRKHAQLFVEGLEFSCAAS